jgi:hypothetical protein
LVKNKTVKIKGKLVHFDKRGDGRPAFAARPKLTVLGIMQAAKENCTGSIKLAKRLNTWIQKVGRTEPISLLKLPRLGIALIPRELAIRIFS